MNKIVLWTMSVGAALSAATIYLTQPLLDVLHTQFNSSLSQAGLIVTVTQIGYAAGILFLVPLGDIINKKWLIQIKLLLVALVMLVAGMSQTLTLLLVASFAIGIFATAAQDFVPLAADLAPEAQRGKIIGTVMSGLLIGILLSRTFSGATAHHFGWRAVFFIGAALVGLLLIFTTILVPSHSPTVQLKYTQLMRSMGRIFIDNPLLRLTMLAQGLIGAIMSSFWTVLTFHLSDAPFHLSTSSIGLFGLAGAAGAVAAPIAGKLSDKRGPLLNIKFGMALIFISFVLMYLFQTSILVLIMGAIFFDLGVQSAFISHQTIIYAMHPQARARINSLFMTALFVFFSLGSFLGTLAFSYYGWSGLILLALICCALSFFCHLLLTLEYKSIRKSP